MREEGEERYLRADFSPAAAMLALHSPMSQAYNSAQWNASGIGALVLIL